MQQRDDIKIKKKKKKKTWNLPLCSLDIIQKFIIYGLWIDLQAKNDLDGHWLPVTRRLKRQDNYYFQLIKCFPTEMV